MHVMKIMYEELMRGSVEGCQHVHTSHEDSMGCGLIKIEVSEMEKLDKIMRD